jgi:toxin ParE1/3/4
MAFKIIWSPQAVDGLRELTSYIAQDKPDVAKRFGLLILESVKYLPDNPLQGSMVREFKDPRYRQLVLKPYRVIYRVYSRVKKIDILRVWHGARGTPEI